MTKESKARKTEEPRNPAEETADATRRTLSEATRAGQRISEEALQWWLQMMSGAGWQKQMEQFNDAAGKVLPLVRHNCDEMFEMWRSNARSGTELLKKSIDTARNPIPDGNQGSWAEIWMATVKAAQNNVEAAAQFGIHAVDSWAQFLRRNVEATTQTSQ